ncbi:syndecan-4 [Pseudorasbora parva]|uniref:syndecan-4 n=1 Tax=Pseudorasbora parva TaxID=51549 RepID=UPI00351ED410
MLKVYLMLVLSAAAAVFAESVRETETWVPLKSTSPHEDLESSGDSTHEDFQFADLNPVDDEDDVEDDYDDYEDMSGSGSSEISTTIEDNHINNRIPDLEGPIAPRPTIDERILVKKNEVLHEQPNGDDGHPSNVLMTVAEEESLFSNTEVLAAVIAGGAVGLIFAILLIVLLVHFVLRIKKKDEGSYDLGKTPIYKKAPTAEIYA